MPATDAPPPLHRSRSAGRVLHLLDAVVTGGSLTLSEAAETCAMPVSTALRHLHVLADRGYVARDDQGRYSVGPSFMRLALASFQAGPYARLSAAAQPALERLVERTDETAYLAVRDGTEAVYVASVESSRAIRHVGWVGRSVPIDGTAVGQALLGCRPDEPTGDAPPHFLNVGAIEPDVSAVVAPVYSGDRVVAAISLLGPAERLIGDRLERAADAVVDAARATSDAMTSMEVGP